ncbi:MAG: Rieske 2Fe-2S domain-containing protein [Chitinophagales bacterium]|nr:Rieske 2Fe-2S domain-containing protein [Chitinophagales bacterium]
MFKISEDVRKQIESLPHKEIFVVTIEGKEICFANIDGKPHAFLNRCPHAAARLSEGTCNARGIISCPLHGYKFNVQTGKDVDQNGYRLRIYKLQYVEGELFIQL